MNKSIIKTVFFTMIVCLSCKPKKQVTSASDKLSFDLLNSSNVDINNALVYIDAQDLKSKFKSKISNISVSNDIPFQLNDLDGDGAVDQLSIVANFKSNEKKSIEVKLLSDSEDKPNFKKRTQAEISHKINGEWKGREYQEGVFKNVSYLRVPDEHTDHSWFIRYEGPGIESDLVGYRFYLDWRNAVDVFGKKTNEMVLQKVGLDGFDSYHEPSEWGMDILKVGKSLGLGSIGFWDGEKAVRVEKTDSIDCRIVLDGDIESKIRTRYFGWNIDNTKTTLISDLSMHAGSRLVKNDIEISDMLSNICTGIVKHKSAELLKGEKDEYKYLATWGDQSMAEDKMGMAVFYKTSDEVKITEDEFSDIVVLNTSSKNISYYFLSTWEQGVSGVKSKDAFVNLLDSHLNALNNPIVVATNN